MYTLWAGLLLISELLILLVLWRGAKWREEVVVQEAKRATQQ